MAKLGLRLKTAALVKRQRIQLPFVGGARTRTPYVGRKRGGPKKDKVEYLKCPNCESASVTRRETIEKGSKEISGNLQIVKGKLTSHNLVAVYDCKNCGKPFSIPVK